jgi:hypothetical protein
MILDELAEAFVDGGPAMLRWLEDNTPVRFTIVENFPGYHPENPGGKMGDGRSVKCPLFPFGELGESTAISAVVGKHWLAVCSRVALILALFRKRITEPYVYLLLTAPLPVSSLKWVANANRYSLVVALLWRPVVLIGTPR